MDTTGDDVICFSIYSASDSEDPFDIDYIEDQEDDEDQPNEDDEFIEKTCHSSMSSSFIPASSEWAEYIDPMFPAITTEQNKDDNHNDCQDTSSNHSFSSASTLLLPRPKLSSISTSIDEKIVKKLERHKYSVLKLSTGTSSVSSDLTVTASCTCTPCTPCTECTQFVGLQSATLPKSKSSKKRKHSKTIVRRPAGNIQNAISGKEIAKNAEIEKLRQTHIDSVRKTLALASFPVFHVPSMDFFAKGNIVPVGNSLHEQHQDRQEWKPQSPHSNESTTYDEHVSYPNVCFWDHHPLDETVERAGDVVRPAVLRRGRKSIPISRIRKPGSNEVSYTFFGCFCSWECAHSFQSLYFSGKYTESLLLARKEIDGVSILTPLRQHPHPFVLKKYGGDYEIQRFRHWWTEDIDSDILIQTVNNGDVSYALNTGTQIFGVTDICERRRRGGGVWCGEDFELATTPTDDINLSEDQKETSMENLLNWHLDDSILKRRETAILSCLNDDGLTAINGAVNNNLVNSLPPLQCGKRLRKHVLLHVSMFNVPFLDRLKSIDSNVYSNCTATNGIKPINSKIDFNGPSNASTHRVSNKRFLQQNNAHTSLNSNISSTTLMPTPAPTLVVKINDETSRKATLHQNQMDELIHMDYARRVKKRVSSNNSVSPTSSTASTMSNASHGFQRVHDAPKYVRKAIDASVKKKTEIHSMLYNASPHSSTTRGNHRVQTSSSTKPSTTSESASTSTTVFQQLQKKRGKKTVEEAALEAFEKNDEAKELLETVLNAAVLHTNKANDYLDLSIRGADTGGGDVTFDAATGVLTVSGRSSHVSRSSDLALLVNAGGDGVAAIRAAMAYANADAFFDVGISHKRKRKRRDASLCESLDQLAENLSAEKD